MKLGIPWVGGKQQLVGWIEQYIPPHKVYVEPFGGGGGFLLNKARSPKEIYNEIDASLVNLFKVLREPDTFNELMARMRFTERSQGVFEEAIGVLSTPLFVPSVEHAWALYTVLYLSMDKNVKNPHFNIGVRGGFNTAPYNKLDFFEAIKDRLKSVVITNKDAMEYIKGDPYNAPDVFMYIDPPYIDTMQGMYTGQFPPQKHIQMLNHLEKVKFKWMISSFDHPLYLDWATANGFRIETHERTAKHALASNKKNQRIEVLIMNYEIAPQLKLFD